ncbi:hypothetical protein TNCV_122381 [Trichonephila clavipes]|nr:hypothetical protein TNCV_122381 [Trichonephila clavipes]
MSVIDDGPHNSEPRLSDVGDTRSSTLLFELPKRVNCNGYDHSISRFQSRYKTQFTNKPHHSNQYEAPYFKSTFPQFRVFELDADQDPREGNPNKRPPETHHCRGYISYFSHYCECSCLCDCADDRSNDAFNGRDGISVGLEREVWKTDQNDAQQREEYGDDFAETTLFIQKYTSNEHSEYRGGIEQQRCLGDRQVDESKVVTANSDVSDDGSDKKYHVAFGVIPQLVIPKDDNRSNETRSSKTSKTKDFNRA